MPGSASLVNIFWRGVVMQAHEIMKTEVIKVKKHDNVRAVIAKFIKYGISGLPIVDDHDRMLGYISDGDIMRHIGKQKNHVMDFFSFVYIARGNDDDFEEKAKEIMELNVLKIASRKVITVSWDEKIGNIASILGSKEIKKLPVERDGRLVGIISRGDVIRTAFRALM